MTDRFKISYDEVGRMGIDVHELYDIFKAYTKMSFDEWWGYMKKNHLEANEHFIREWITVEAARDICRYEILRIAEAHDFADPVLFVYVAEEILTASESAEKMACSDEFIAGIKDGVAKLLNEDEEKGTLRIYDYEGEKIFIFEFDGQLWFSSEQVCDILKILDISQLEDDEKMTRDDATIINEAGLFKLISSVNTLEAKNFKQWLVREVLSKIESL